MPTKRVVDLAALIRASHDVLTKHVALQGHQLDHYSRSSSLAKFIKAQASKAVPPLLAASPLVFRPSEATPLYSTRVGNEPSQSTAIPSNKSVARVDESPAPKQGLEQDHFYERSQTNGPTQPTPRGQLNIEQEQVKQGPLPDGTILPRDSDVARIKKDADDFPQPHPTKHSSRGLYHEKVLTVMDDVSSLPRADKPRSANEKRRLQRQAEHQIPEWSAGIQVDEPFKAQDARQSENSDGLDREQDTFYSPPQDTSLELSSFPRVKIPKTTSNIQESDEHVHDQGINQDVYYSSSHRTEKQAIPKAQAVPELERVSEDIYSEIFYSPKIAKMLSSASMRKPSPSEIELQRPKAAEPSQFKSTKSVDHESFSTRDRKMAMPGDSTQDTTDVQTLATDIANDLQSNPGVGGEVRNTKRILYELMTDRLTDIS